MANITLLPSAKVPVIYDGDNTMTTEWYRFFWNIYGFTGTGVVPVDRGGTGLDTIGNHQVIIGNANNVFEPAVFTGSGINITYSPGAINLAIGASGVTPGTYGDASRVSQITINQYGAITFAQNVNIGIDASQIITGTINTARISGNYVGITGVGTLTSGTWNATTIAANRGGTGQSSYVAGDMLYATGTTALSSLAIGANTYLLTSSGTAPQWTSPSSVTIGTATNLAGGLANQIPYQTGPGATTFMVAPTVANTYLNWSGSAFQWSANPLGDVVGPASATDNAIARFDTTTGKLIQNSTVTISDVGDVANVNSIEFDITPSTLPTAQGTLYWDNADSIQTLSLVMEGGNAVQQIGEEQYYRIKCSAAITEGQVVMFTGTVGASGGLTGAPATGLTASTASYVMGVATESGALNDWIYVTSFGLVRGINTTAFADGDILYYDPTVTGGLTTSIPTAPNAKVQVCAVVHAASNGSLFVRPSFGGILGQYEGDVQVTTPANGNLLIRDQTAGKWVNALLTAGSGVSISNTAGAVTISATGTGGTVTSVAALTLGTTGTDLSSTVANSTTTPVITLNVPTASATNRGALSAADWTTFNSKQPAGSYLTAVSVVSANGFAGTSSGGLTPALTLSTTITGLLKGNGTAISAATSGTDYAPATSGSSILYGNGAGGFSNVTIGSGLLFSGGTLSSTAGGGSVTSVTLDTGSTGLTVSGGTTQTITGAGTFTVAGTLGVGYGGTGLTTVTAGYIPYGNSATALTTSANLKYLSSVLYSPAFQATTSSGFYSQVNGSNSIGVGPNVTFQNLTGTNYAAAMQFGASGDMMFWRYPGSGVWGEQARFVNSTGNLQFSSTLNGGVSFNGGASATLNDYETGTWTPVLNRSSSAPTVTYSAQVGYYTKIGNIVTVTIAMAWSANSGGSGYFRISGFPYAAKNVSQNYGGLLPNQWEGFTLSAGRTFLGGAVVPNQTFADLTASGSGVAIDIVNTVAATGYFYATATYMTA